VNEFVLWCAQKGNVERVTDNGKKENLTLLVAPMTGFYSVTAGEENPGKTQMRIAYILSPEDMKLVPVLFKKLFEEFEAGR
jgi:aspartate aminotransferase